MSVRKCAESAASAARPAKKARAGGGAAVAHVPEIAHVPAFSISAATPPQDMTIRELRAMLEAAAVPCSHLKRKADFVAAVQALSDAPAVADVAHIPNPPQRSPSPHLPPALPLLHLHYTDHLIRRQMALPVAPWSSVAQTTAKFMRILRSAYHFFVQCALASRVCLARFLLQQPRPFPFASKHPLYAAACGTASLRDECRVPPEQDNESLVTWALWLPNYEEAILMEVDHAEANPLHAAATARRACVELQEAARARVWNAGLSAISLRLASTSLFHQHAPMRCHMAEIIIARVYRSFRQKIESSSADLFKKCLRTVKSAKLRIQSQPDMFQFLQSGNFSMVRDLMIAGDRSCVHATNFDGKTPLHFSVIFAHLQSARAFVIAGADLNAKDGTGFTPLAYSALYGNEELARMLVDAGADVNAASQSGRVAMHLAAKSSTKGHVRVTALLIDARADLNAKTEEGSTALHVAARRGCHAIARKLVAGGAAVNVKDGDGCSPLHLAVRGCHLQVVELLASAGSDLNGKDKTGSAPLHVACKGKGSSLEVVRALVEARADVNVKNKRGKTPLECATANLFCVAAADYLRAVVRQLGRGGLEA